MRFDNTTLADLIRALRSNPTETSEKRRQPRVGVRTKAHIIVDGPDGKQAVPIFVRDLSCGGLGFTGGIQLPARKQFRLLLSNEAAQSILCEVAHCVLVAPEIFQIGAKFIGEIATAIAPLLLPRRDASGSPTSVCQRRCLTPLPTVVVSASHAQTHAGL